MDGWMDGWMDGSVDDDRWMIDEYRIGMMSIGSMDGLMSISHRWVMMSIYSVDNDRWVIGG